MSDISLSKPWSAAEAFHCLGSLAKVPLMKRPLTTPAKKSLGKYKQPSELVLWFRFIEGAGAIVRDFSNYGNHGTIVGMTWAKDGGLTVGSFDGNDYINCGNSPTLDVYQHFTFACWIKRNAYATYQGLVCKSTAGGVGYFLFIYDTYFRIQYYDGTTSRYAYSTTSISLGVPYSAAGSWDGTYLKIYVNGNLERTSADLSATPPLSNTEDVIIGNRGATGTLWYNGLINEVRIYSRALSIEESKALHLGLI